MIQNHREIHDLEVGDVVKIRKCWLRSPAHNDLGFVRNAGDRLQRVLQIQYVDGLQEVKTDLTDRWVGKNWFKKVIL